MSEENKALVLRIQEESFNRGNYDALDDLITSDAIYHDHPPGFPSGPEGTKQFAAMLRCAFPDFHATVDDVIAEGDKVVLRLTVRGTHQGELMGIAPTGRRVEMSGIDIARVADGKLAELWSNFDQMGMMQQLGVVPPPGQAGSQPT